MVVYFPIFTVVKNDDPLHVKMFPQNGHWGFIFDSMIYPAKG